MSYTPKPWIAAWDKDDHHIWANGCDIAFLPGEEQGYECGAKLKTLEANGKLMAAAPDLLEALVFCLSFLTANDDGEDDVVERIKAAKFAINKATGE